MEKMANHLYTLTSLRHFTDRHTFLMSHEPQDGEDGKPSIHTGSAVDDGNYKGVSKIHIYMTIFYLCEILKS